MTVSHQTAAAGRRSPRALKALTTRSLSQSRPLLLALALTATAAATAHDWTSPTPGARRAPHPLPGPQIGHTVWPGLVWAGPEQGAPATPHATDCRRPPQPFDVGSGMPSEPQQARRGAAPEGATSDSAEALRPLAMAPTTRSRRDAAPGAASHSTAAPAPALLAAPAAPAATTTAGRAAERAELQDDAPAVSAGMVDDNADFGEFRAFLARHARLAQRPRSVTGRVRLTVQDGAGRAVPDAQVRVTTASGEPLPVWARTDAGGQAWLMPQKDAQPRGDADAPWTVEVSRTQNGRTQVQRVSWQPGQRDALQVRLEHAVPPPVRLDVAFVIDATGSMADEIDKLKRSMRGVAEAIARLPGAPQVCYALVAYRDRGDAFFVRGVDFTNDLDAFQHELATLQASAGGDYPEAQNEAMHTAIHRLSWRGEGTARLALLLADAPPHQDYGAPHADHNARAAAARGIKVMGIGASGLDRTGELVMRQTAQFTGGRFVFLTYADARRPSSGPGRETVHDVSNYSVETLDRLVVRLVGEEMARWPRR